MSGRPLRRSVSPRSQYTTTRAPQRPFCLPDALRFPQAARSFVGRWYEYLHSGTSFIDPASRPCGGDGGRLGATASSSSGDYPPECRLTAAEIEMMIAVPKEVGAAGVVIWGGGADQGNRTLCEEFKGYFANELGPAVARGLHGGGSLPR